jgi:hypothetical protein
MADATPTPALSSTADTMPYVPVSWMAVSAVLAAGAFLVLLLFFGYSAAFKDHKPLIMPSLLILPVVGVVLSFVARRMIRNSEGTRTGESLANAAWWISVIGGLGYSAYLFAIEYSIRREAKGELEQWVGYILKEDKENHDRAFTRVIEANRRGNLPAAGLVAQFPEIYIAFGQSDIVRIAKRNPGPDVCKFEADTLKDWMYRPGSIDCVVTGLLKCPEGTFPMEIPLRGNDAKAGMEGGGRQWSIIMPPNGLVVREKSTLTPYGWRIEELEKSGSGFAKELVVRSSSGPNAAQLVYQTMIRETPDIPFLEASRLVTPTGWAMAGGPASAVAFTKNYLASTKEYSDYLQNHLFKLPEGRDASPEQKQRFLTIWNTIGLLPTGLRIKGNDKIDSNAFLSVTDTAIEVSVPCEIPFPGTTGEMAAARGRVVVACTEPDVLAEVKRLRAEANPDQGTASPPPDFMKRAFKWRVVRIESDLHEVRMAPQQSGPGGTPPPPAFPG